MQKTLYEKVMVGKKPTYRVYTPTAPEGADDMTDEQLVTMAVSVGVTCLMVMEKMLKPHARNSRKIRQLEYAILDMAKGAGAMVDPEIVDYWIEVWNSTMSNIQRGMVHAEIKG
jgi:hypothetical protein